MATLDRGRGMLTYGIFTIGDREFTIGSRPVRIVSPGKRNPSSNSCERGPTMKKENETVRLELTPEQKQLIKKQTGKDAEAVELSVQELEERIAPTTGFLDADV
jgi:hypothetical protein